MDTLMLVTKDHDNDPTYKEVSDFMVPSSVGSPFLDKPGTFDANMEARIADLGFSMCCVNVMMMKRYEMIKQPAPHNKGITFDKFKEHRGYAMPGYQPKYPKPGEDAPDGTILSIDGGAPSTLLAEAKKVAEQAGSEKVMICFDGITCPFFRAYAAEDMYKVSNGIPMLHVYIREAEPCDEFDAGGMHCTTPLKMKRFIPVHKNEAERAEAAKDTKIFMEGFMGKGKVHMWMDAMDDKLEAAYEARPWRWYVIQASTGKIIDGTNLAPFNMAGKLRKLKAATA